MLHKVLDLCNKKINVSKMSSEDKGTSPANVERRVYNNFVAKVFWKSKQWLKKWLWELVKSEAEYGCYELLCVLSPESEYFCLNLSMFFKRRCSFILFDPAETIFIHTHFITCDAVLRRDCFYAEVNWAW